MPRLFAMLAAVVLSSLVISSACVATATSELPIRFSLDSRSGNAPYRLNLGLRGGGASRWDSGFTASNLRGLDPSRLNGPAAQPVRFALVREAGRLDCTGTGRKGTASGNCHLTADLGFLALLRQRGIEAPDSREQFGLVALDVKSELLTSLAASGFEVREVDDLMGLAALGVDPGFIREFARAGYRPRTVNSLMEFAALGITPDYVRSFVRLGYSDFDASDMVQLRALGIDADFVAGFDRVGYGRLPADKLVELKAVGVTPADAVRYRDRRGALPPIAKLIEYHLLGDWTLTRR